MYNARGRGSKTLKNMERDVCGWPLQKPTTIGSTDDILANENEEEVARKQQLRLKRFFESTSGPKSLPQSMTTAHQEMKAQLAAMQQQQQHQELIHLSCFI